MKTGGKPRPVSQFSFESNTGSRFRPPRMVKSGTAVGARANLFVHLLILLRVCTSLGRRVGADSQLVGLPTNLDEQFLMNAQTHIIRESGNDNKGLERTHFVGWEKSVLSYAGFALDFAKRCPKGSSQKKN